MKITGVKARDASHEVRDRVLSGIVMVAVMVLVVYAGGWTLFLAGAVLVTVALHELFAALRLRSIRPLFPLGALAALLFFAEAQFETRLSLVVLLAFALIIWLVPRTGTYRRRDLAVTLACALYVGVLPSTALLIRGLPQGFDWLILVLGGTASADVGAWAIGSRFGKHRLAPRISPRKTWEGLAGGVAACFLVVMILAAVLHLPALTWPWSVALAFALPLGDILGDLAASAVKRYAGIKNYGNFIPGHGGVLDRIDGHLITLPIAYAIIQLALGG